MCELILNIIIDVQFLRIIYQMVSSFKFSSFFKFIIIDRLYLNQNINLNNDKHDSLKPEHDYLSLAIVVADVGKPFEELLEDKLIIAVRVSANLLCTVNLYTE